MYSQLTSMHNRRTSLLEICNNSALNFNSTWGQSSNYQILKGANEKASFSKVVGFGIRSTTEKELFEPILNDPTDFPPLPKISCWDYKLDQRDSLNIAEKQQKNDKLPSQTDLHFSDLYFEVQVENNDWTEEPDPKSPMLPMPVVQFNDERNSDLRVVTFEINPNQAKFFCDPSRIKAELEKCFRTINVGSLEAYMRHGMVFLRTKHEPTFVALTGKWPADAFVYGIRKMAPMLENTVIIDVCKLIHDIESKYIVQQLRHQGIEWTEIMLKSNFVTSTFIKAKCVNGATCHELVKFGVQIGKNKYPIYFGTNFN